MDYFQGGPLVSDKDAFEKAASWLSGNGFSTAAKALLTHLDEIDPPPSDGRLARIVVAISGDDVIFSEDVRCVDDEWPHITDVTHEAIVKVIIPRRVVPEVQGEVVTS